MHIEKIIVQRQKINFKVSPYLSAPTAIVRDWCHLSMLSFLPPLTNASHSLWPQGKGQVAECLIPSRTHYKGLEREGEQRSLCDTVSHRQTDTQDGGELLFWP